MAAMVCAAQSPRTALYTEAMKFRLPLSVFVSLRRRVGVVVLLLVALILGLFVAQKHQKLACMSAIAWR